MQSFETSASTKSFQPNTADIQMLLRRGREDDELAVYASSMLTLVRSYKTCSQTIKPLVEVAYEFVVDKINRNGTSVPQEIDTLKYIIEVILPKGPEDLSPELVTQVQFYTSSFQVGFDPVSEPSLANQPESSRSSSYSESPPMQFIHCQFSCAGRDLYHSTHNDRSINSNFKNKYMDQPFPGFSNRPQASESSSSSSPSLDAGPSFTNTERGEDPPSSATHLGDKPVSPLDLTGTRELDRPSSTYHGEGCMVEKQGGIKGQLHVDTALNALPSLPSVLRTGIKDSTFLASSYTPSTMGTPRMWTSSIPHTPDSLPYAGRSMAILESTFALGSATEFQSSPTLLVRNQSPTAGHGGGFVSTSPSNTAHRASLMPTQFSDVEHADKNLRFRSASKNAVFSFIFGFLILCLSVVTVAATLSLNRLSFIEKMRAL